VRKCTQNGAEAAVGNDRIAAWEKLVVVREGNDRDVPEEPSAAVADGLTEHSAARGMAAVARPGSRTRAGKLIRAPGLPGPKMSKDVREFIRRLEAIGLRVESTPGHYRVLRKGKPLHKQNGMPFMLPFWPDTIRWRRAAIVELRKLGINL
jgi:hypothetical protein